MNRNGHLGITLLVFAPVAYLLVTHGNPGLALVSWIGVQAVEPLPDRDFQVPGLSHRGVSHSLLAVLVVGSVLGVGGWVLGAQVFDGLLDVLPLALDALHRLIGILPAPIAHHLDPLLTDLTPTEMVTGTRHQFGARVNREVFAMFGFGVGVYGMLAHLLGDVITIAGINPFLPFSHARISLTPLHADNRLANSGLLVVGLLAIVVVLSVALPGIGLGLGVSAPASVAPVGVSAAQSTQSPRPTPRPTPNQTAATVELDSTNNTTATAVVVSEVRLPNGGFVAIHHEGFSEGGVLRGSEITVSRYLPPGPHRNVTIPLGTRPVTTTQTLVAVADLDTDDDHQYDYLTSGGETDYAYLAHQNGSTVILNRPARVRPVQNRRATTTLPAHRITRSPSVASAPSSVASTSFSAVSTATTPSSTSRATTGMTRARSLDTGTDHPNGDGGSLVGRTPLLMLLGGGLVVAGGLTLIGRLTRSP